MSQVLRQSTQVIVRIGPFVDVTDGATPETTVTLSGADQAELLKAAGAATVDISGATWAAITGSDGWYNLTLTTSHTDTIGTLEVVVQDVSLCLPVHARFQVVEEAAYDAIYAASASPATSANVSAVETDTQDIQARLPAALVSGRIDASVGAMAANVITAAATAADFGTEVGTAVWATTTRELTASLDPSAAAIADAVWDEATTGHVTAGTFGEQLKTDVDAILVDTAEIGAAGAGLTAIPWNASWDAEVQSECADALTAFDPATATNLATVDTVVDAIKVQTDKFVFTVANQVDANVQSINDTALTGDGSGTPWGPA